MLIDYGSSLNMEDAEILIQNLMEQCCIAPNMTKYKLVPSDELKIIIENDWIERIAQIFDNASKIANTQGLPSVFTELLATFNEKQVEEGEDFKVI